MSSGLDMMSDELQWLSQFPVGEAQLGKLSYCSCATDECHYT